MSNGKIIKTMQDKAFRIEEFNCLVSDIRDYDFFSDQLPDGIIDRFNGDNNLIANNITVEGDLVFPEETYNKGPVYLFLKLFCEKKIETVFCPRFSAGGKMWLNNQLIGFDSHWLINPIITTLIKGENIIAFEFTNVDAESLFSLRVSSFKFENLSNLTSIYNGNAIIENRFITISYRMQTQNELTFVLSALNNIAIDRQKKAKVRFVWIDGEKLIEERHIDYFTVNHFHLPPPQPSEGLNALRIECIGVLLSGEEFVIDRTILYPDCSSVYDNLRRKAQDALNTGVLSYEDSLKTRLFISGICSKENSEGVFRDALELQTLLNWYEKGQKKGEKGQKKGEKMTFLGQKRVYFQSQLDQTVEFYDIYFPKDYSKNHKYPLLLYLSTYRYSQHAFDLRNSNHPILIADVSGRGVTMGSYIGEAAILEIIENICDKFSVDPSRIYLAGTSNGAAASLSMAQNHPHMFAGIYAVSGVPNKPNILNLYNIPVMVASSEMEIMYDVSYKQVFTRYKRLREHKFVMVDKMCHAELGYLPIKSQFIQYITSKQLNLYPDTVIFRTERMQHRRAYWITLHNITYSKKYARVRADIKNGDIYVRIVHSDGFTIKIPPQIPRAKFKVVVNGKSFDFENCMEENLHFYRTGKGYTVSQTPPPYPISKKGSGLLSIYHGPMEIYVANSDNPIYTDMADHFSRPVTNGFDTVIYVQYPIYRKEEITQLNRDGNIVIIDDLLCENPQLEFLRSKLKIKPQNDGFTYKGETHNGRFSIMQVIPNPYNEKSSILFVSSNDPIMIKMNLFIKKVIIPSYANGFHPYWSNEALIFKEFKYYSVYEWGMELQEIRT